MLNEQENSLLSSRELWGSESVKGNTWHGTIGTKKTESGIKICLLRKGKRRRFPMQDGRAGPVFKGPLGLI